MDEKRWDEDILNTPDEEIPDDEPLDVLLIKANKILNEEPGRNDPCPCGSGKKYKKCCLPLMNKEIKTTFKITELKGEENENI